MTETTHSSSIASVFFWVSRDFHTHEREIYSPLDFLGDVGGLADALLAIGSWLILILEMLSGS